MSRTNPSQVHFPALNRKILPDQTTTPPPIKMKRLILPKFNQDTVPHDDPLEELPDLDGDFQYQAVLSLYDIEE